MRQGEKKKLEDVFLIPAELRERILIVFGEMPRKYGELLGPLEQELAQAIHIPKIEVILHAKLPAQTLIPKEEPKDAK